MKLTAFPKRARAIIGLAMTGFILFSATASAQNLVPYSLRQVWYIEDEERPYWEVRVTCNDLKTFRYMIRYEESAPWCAKQAPDLCAKEKVQLAFDICDDSFSERIAEAQRQQTLEAEELARRDRLKAELLQQAAVLQERRRQLDSRKAELQRREQALSARESELSEQKAKLQ
ncbi:MAG: hypothetical protein AAF431_17650 [Pseudomonadota bacterium]